MSGKQFYMYGLKGPDQNYAPVPRYEFLYAGDFNTHDIRASISRLKDCGAEKIYMIANYHGLRGDYENAKNESSIEKAAIFKDILERSGILVDAVLG